MEHVTCSVRGEVHSGFCEENLKDRDHFQGLILYRKIILKWMLKGRGKDDAG